MWLQYQVLIYPVCLEYTHNIAHLDQWELLLKPAGWPSGLRRRVQAAVQKGVGSNPTSVTYIHVGFAMCVTQVLTPKGATILWSAMTETHVTAYWQVSTASVMDTDLCNRSKRRDFDLQDVHEIDCWPKIFAFTNSHSMISRLLSWNLVRVFLTHYPPLITAHAMALTPSLHSPHTIPHPIPMLAQVPHLPDWPPRHANGMMPQLSILVTYGRMAEWYLEDPAAFRGLCMYERASGILEIINYFLQTTAVIYSRPPFRCALGC